MEPGWALVLPAYLLGTFPTAILVGRRAGLDPTRDGVRQPRRRRTPCARWVDERAPSCSSATSARGRRPPALGLATGNRAVAVACGLAAVVGHVAPATRGFRGGKGVATGAGTAFVLLPLPALGLAVLWVVAAKASGTASVASLLIAVGLPVAAALAGRPLGEVLAFAACGALVVVRHRGNIDRLRSGKERTLLPGASE